MENIGLIIVHYIVVVFALLTLCFGMHFLIHHSKGIRSNQNLYLISYTTTEIFLNVYHIFNATLLFIYPMYEDKFWLLAIRIFIVIIWITNTVTLVVMTLNRFLEVYLNIQYEVYVTRRKTLFIIFGMWITGLVSSAVLLICLRFLDNFTAIFYDMLACLWTIIEIIVLLNGTIVYLYIYRKCRNNRPKVSNVISQNNVNSDSNENRQNRFKKRKVFIPAFITITFFLFVFIPDTVSVIMNYTYTLAFDSLIGTIIYNISYAINTISDVIIYVVLMQRDIRTFLLKMWRRNTGSVHWQWKCQTSNLYMPYISTDDGNVKPRTSICHTFPLMMAMSNLGPLYVIRFQWLWQCQTSDLYMSYISSDDGNVKHQTSMSYRVANGL